MTELSLHFRLDRWNWPLVLTKKKVCKNSNTFNPFNDFFCVPFWKGRKLSDTTFLPLQNNSRRIYKTSAPHLSLVKNESHLMTDLPRSSSSSRKASDLLAPSCCCVRIIIKVHRGKLVALLRLCSLSIFLT